ncbi:MAG: hypothetical protein ACLFWM_09930 [Actinomycetota bacterium]
MSRPSLASARVVAPGMRRLLVVAGTLVALAGIQLFVFSERTEEYFAWTIDPPLTAAFLGAAYWSSVFFQFAAAREKIWANARIAVPTVLVFTALTLGVTLLHLENFHLGASFGAATRAVTWGWIAIYATVPVVMASLWLVQAWRPGGDPERVAALPSWVRVLVAAQALLLGAMGLALLVSPTSAADWWPWPLTALTGRAIGAWVVSLGVAAAHALVENCARRLRPAALGYVAFSLLQAWALARYPGDFAWSSGPGIVYLGFLASTLVAGVTVLPLSRQTP